MTTGSSSGHISGGKISKSENGACLKKNAPTKAVQALASEIKAVGTGSMPLMLAEKYDEEDFSKVQGWYMSEKLDGVRCFWNGSSMYSRNGKLFYPPDWFRKLLPRNLALDGELWTKRDDF